MIKIITAFVQKETSLHIKSSRVRSLPHEARTKPHTGTSHWQAVVTASPWGTEIEVSPMNVGGSCDMLPPSRSERWWAVTPRQATARPAGRPLTHAGCGDAAPREGSRRGRVAGSCRRCRKQSLGAEGALDLRSILQHIPRHLKWVWKQVQSQSRLRTRNELWPAQGPQKPSCNQWCWRKLLTLCDDLFHGLEK